MPVDCNVGGPSPALSNLCGEDVSCTAPATRNTSLQILSKRPTLAILLETAAKLTRLAHICQGRQGAQSIAPATQHDAWTSKVVRTCGVPTFSYFFHIWTSKCASPQRRALFQHPNFQKALRSWGALCIFTSKCALRHELPNVLRATAACIFSTSNLPKVLPQWGVLAFWLRHVLRALHATTARNVFSSLSWPDGSAPAALANLLFDPPEPQNIGKTQCVSRLFYFFAHFVGLLSSDFSSLTLPASAFPSVNIVGSLTSKLPSIILVAIACCHSLGVPCVVRQRSYICLYRYGCRGMNEFRKQKSLGTTNWNPAAFFDFPPFPALLSFWAMPVSRQIERCMQMNAWLMTLWPYAGDCAIEFSLFLIFRAKPKNEMHQRISEC